MNTEFLDIVSATHLETIDDFTLNQVEVVLSSGQILNVPEDPANRHYAEILRQVDEGTLTIQEADNG